MPFVLFVFVCFWQAFYVITGCEGVKQGDGRVHISPAETTVLQN
jgi:hypothetical protein